MISRITEAFLAMPFLIMAIALAAFLGPSLTNAMIAIGLSAMPIFIRLTTCTGACGQDGGLYRRGALDRARSSRYHASLHPSQHRAAYHRSGDIDGGNAIIAEASLSFLGLGQQAPAASWGSMLNVAKNYLSQAPWDGHLAGCSHLPRGDRFQSPGRWPAGMRSIHVNTDNPEGLIL